MTQEPGEERQASAEQSVDQAIVILLRHFSAIQIVASFDWTAEDGSKVTSRYAKGAGNWYTRIGCVQTWLANQMTEKDE